jgi:hypothetical protein
VTRLSRFDSSRTNIDHVTLRSIKLRKRISKIYRRGNLKKQNKTKREKNKNNTEKKTTTRLWNTTLLPRINS